MVWNLGPRATSVWLPYIVALALRREPGSDGDGERAVGSIAVGHRADLHLLNAPSATHLAYRPGIPLTHAVWRAGVGAR